MTKRVQQKASLIDMPRAGETSPVERATAQEGVTPAAVSHHGARPLPPDILPGPRPYTGVGQVMSVLGRSSPLGQELEAAKARLREFDNASPVRRLDAKAVVRSRWANRDEAEFVTEDFVALKAEIESAGGNVQPIRVRPLRGVFDGQTPGREGEQRQAFDRQTPPAYEIIFGHRRHRACLELGLPVNAVIEDMEDAELFQVMDRENRLRKNLSPWEQGHMYRKALDGGLFPSLRRLAEVLGVNLSVASQSVAIARLPADVVQAFVTPLDIQFRWAALLSDAIQKDPEGVLDRAKGIRDWPLERRQAKVVLEELLAPSKKRAAGANPVSLEKDGKVVALLKPKGRGGLSIEIRQSVDLGKAESAIRKLIGL